MKHEIPVSVRQYVAALEADALYVCDNSEYVIVFDFDEDWDEHEIKTARFNWCGKYQDVIFSGNVCEVPKIDDAPFFEVGVYAGDLETSSPARVKCKKSILSGSGLRHDPPPPDVYTQMMALLDTMSEEAIGKVVEATLTQAAESGQFDGKDGEPGTPGTPGTSVTIKSIKESSEDGGSNVVTFSDGKTMAVKNGRKGAQGDPFTYDDFTQEQLDALRGKDGTPVTHSWNGTTLTVTSASGTSSADLKGMEGKQGPEGKTPVRGTDFWTPEDQEAIIQQVNIDSEAYIASELAKRGQLKPEFANDIHECTDTNLLYVLPNGMIYAYIATETAIETVPNFTNLMDDPNATIKTGVRYSQSGAASGTQWKTETSDTSIIIPIPSGSPVIRVRGAGNDAKYNNYIYISYDGKDIFPGTPNYTRTVADNGDITITVTATLANPKYATFAVKSGFNADELIVTVNEEITYTTTEGGVSYAWASTGRAFVPADYEDRIVAVENAAASNTARIVKLENKPASSGLVTMFISPDGNDENSGLSVSAPKKTIRACVEAGASRISAKRGVYKEAINLVGIGELEIFPTDHDKTYVAGEERHPIVFDTSDSLAVSSLATYNSIKRAAYSAANAAYDAVFVKKTLAPVVSASQSSYRAAVWLFSDDEKTVCRKPKPVLTVAECEANANTFCYSGGYIYINADLSGVTKIVVPTITDNGFYVNGADKLVLREVEVRFAGEYTYDLRNCAWVDFYKCASKFTTRASGFHPVNTNGIFRACYATKCFDGFAPNSHGHTTYIDCVSEYNYDDGMSHHAGTEGTVIGGRYEGNGKGGNIPAYGAKVNIYGGLYKNNKQYGIQYAGDGAGNFAQGIVQGAVMVDNPVGLTVQAECIVTAMNCHYAGNVKDKDTTAGVLIEY